MRPLNTTRSKPDSPFLEWSESFFIILLSFLLKYKWLCLSRVPLIYLCVSRPLVGPSGLKYAEGLSACHVCFVSAIFLSLFDVHLLAHYFGLFYCLFSFAQTHRDWLLWQPVLHDSIFSHFFTFSNLYYVTSSNHLPWYVSKSWKLTSQRKIYQLPVFILEIKDLICWLSRKLDIIRLITKC